MQWCCVNAHDDTLWFPKITGEMFNGVRLSRMAGVLLYNTDGEPPQIDEDKARNCISIWLL